MAAFDPKQTLSGILVTTLSVERRLLIGVHHDASGLSAMESVTFISPIALRGNESESALYGHRSRLPTLRAGDVGLKPHSIDQSLGSAKITQWSCRSLLHLVQLCDAIILYCKRGNEFPY